MGVGLDLRPAARRASSLRTLSLLMIAAVAGAGCASSGQRASPAALQQQVMDTERAFARTMADRDPGAFSSYLSDEVIFFSGQQPLRGKQAVATEWKGFFDGPSAPFSWEPDHVEVLESGTLALTTGPVHDPSGKVVGRFNSIWRQEAPGRWRIVFDRGSPVCPAAPSGSP